MASTSPSSPGVYVKEVPSTVQAIAGVGTSTAGFIGIIGDPKLTFLPSTGVTDEAVGMGDGATKRYKLRNSNVLTDVSTFKVYFDSFAIPYPALSNDGDSAWLVFPTPPPIGSDIKIDYQFIPPKRITGESVAAGDGVKKRFKLQNSNVLTDVSTFTVRPDSIATQNPTLSNVGNSAWLDFLTPPPIGSDIEIDYQYIPTTPITGESVAAGDGVKKRFKLQNSNVLTDISTFRVHPDSIAAQNPTLSNVGNSAWLVFPTPPPIDSDITIDYQFTPTTPITGESAAAGDGVKKRFKLQKSNVLTDASTFTVLPDSIVAPNPTLSNDGDSAWLEFPTPPRIGLLITIDYQFKPAFTITAKDSEVRLCTNYTDFKRVFGDFSQNSDQRLLAHAVFGFFSNGGARCYVTWVKNDAAVAAVLNTFEGIDEIALVAVPGCTSKRVQAALVKHCAIDTENRFAILDCPESVETSGTLDTTLLTQASSRNVLPPYSPYAAFYFPWLVEFDPQTQLADPSGDGNFPVPPSGHMAGIYARVDATRGVHKSPANEVVFGPVGLKYRIGRSLQDGLNPQGVNCIRELNGNIRVWGARTIGGSDNHEYTYISVRRLIIFLRKSIEQGTQWAVFEPNDAALWSKIRRNITAFLLNVWRDGALFGATPQEAFFVKCDAEENPPERRDLGEVVTLIGVAPVKPAEFVVFRISQTSGPATNT